MNKTAATILVGQDISVLGDSAVPQNEFWVKTEGSQYKFRVSEGTLVLLPSEQNDLPDW